MQTRITKLLEIEYPVIQGGMAWVANAALAANVSKAGGIGFIGAANAPAEWVRREIRRAAITLRCPALPTHSSRLQISQSA